eukprot:jgi/Bigna1/52153/estExt_Genewise1Plus.C_60043
MATAINQTQLDNAIQAAITQHLQDAGHTRPEAVDAVWTLLSGVLVFVMQLGFGLLEAGSIESINSQSILFKNLLDISIVSIGWWSFGYSLSTSTGDAFAGDGSEAFSEPGSDWTLLFFSWAFAATSATIVSGAVAGRILLRTYVTISIVMGWLLFPIYFHWAYATNGWLFEIGFIDFAGSGVVHLGGGMAALVGSIIVGPRLSRFVYDYEALKWVDKKPRGHSVMMSFVGTLLLWFGWYGFNAGSTLGVSDGRFVVASTCLFNTSLATSASILTMSMIGALMPGKFSLFDVMNAALAGLVTVTAGCATVSGWGAIICGILAAPVYKLGSTGIASMRIDDPVDAISVHGLCGALGLLLAGLLSQETLVIRAYGEDYISDFNVGRQLGVQIAGFLAIAGLTAVAMLLLLLPQKYILGTVRINEQDELVGNDYGYFGAHAYPDWDEMVRNAKMHDKRVAEIKRRKEKKDWELGKVTWTKGRTSRSGVRMEKSREKSRDSKNLKESTQNTSSHNPLPTQDVQI